MDTTLFSPLVIGPMTVQNRIAVPPMCMYSAKLGVVQPFHLGHYAKLAQSGAGLVCIEAVAVTPDGRISDGCLGLWSDECEAGMKALVTAMHSAAPQCKVVVQLNHAGRKASTGIAWVHPGALSIAEGGWRVRAPSAIPFSAASPMPLPLDYEECGELVKAFAQAAQRAVRAGVDGIEIHMAHGYLIHQFLSPLSNERIDEYGGAFENRSRFAREVMKAVVMAVPDSVAVGLRVSATDWLEDGWQPEETVELVKQAKLEGLCFVDVSTGGNTPDAKIPTGPGYQVPFASMVREETGLPTFACGLITQPWQAETILRAGDADMIDVGRAMLDDPNWGWHAARALGVEKVPGLSIAPQYARGLHL